MAGCTARTPTASTTATTGGKTRFCMTGSCSREVAGPWQRWLSSAAHTACTREAEPPIDGDWTPIVTAIRLPVQHSGRTSQSPPRPGPVYNERTGRLAQGESASLTRKRSEVQILQRPPGTVERGSAGKFSLDGSGSRDPCYPRSQSRRRWGEVVQRSEVCSDAPCE